MNASRSHLKLVEGSTEKQSATPVYERPESIAFGTVSLLMTASFAGNIINTVSEGLTDVNGYRLLASGLAASAAGFGAYTADRNTRAYNNATEQERNAPETLSRRISVRSFRSASWMAATVVSAEFGVAGVIRAVEASTQADTTLGIGIAATSALVGTKAVKKFKKSANKHKTLKKQFNDYKAENPLADHSYVSEEYRSQLDILARSLVNPERYQKV